MEIGPNKDVQVVFEGVNGKQNCNGQRSDMGEFSSIVLLSMYIMIEWSEYSSFWVGFFSNTSLYPSITMPYCRKNDRWTNWNEKGIVELCCTHTPFSHQVSNWLNESNSNSFWIILSPRQHAHQMCGFCADNNHISVENDMKGTVINLM